MALIADILLAAGALGAAGYCLVLSRRLQRFTRLEDGVGGAIAVLSAQVDDMTRALKSARTAAHDSEKALAVQTARAEQATEQLSLMLASLHDLPDPSVPDRAAHAAAATGTSMDAASQGPAVAAPTQPANRPATTSDAATQVAADPAETVGPGQSATQEPPVATTPMAEPDTGGTGTTETADTRAERGPRFLRRRAVSPKTSAVVSGQGDAFAGAAE